MKAPTKGKKSPRNLPVKFDESLTSHFPTTAAAPSLPVPPHVSTRQIRVIVWLLCIAAAAGAGIGIGRLILANTHFEAISEPAIPIATASIMVAPAPSYSIAAPIPVVDAPMARSAALASPTSQANGGSPLTTVETSQFQPSADISALQPGFTPYSNLQGTIGVPSPIK
jgi:hypothetical protein